MTSSGGGFTYTGVDNLEVMVEAERYNAFLADLVLEHRKGGGPILDFGAGIGTFSRMIRDRGVAVVCLEVDEFQCGILREEGFSVFEGTEVIPDGSHDFVFSLNVFEHIEHDVDSMRECARILRPGGRVLTYVPAFQVLFGHMDRKVEHHRRYTRRGLAALAREAGLDLERTEYVDVAGYFASLAYNLLSDGSGDINKGFVKAYDSYVFPVSRAIDPLTRGFIGKNVFSIATKPA